MAQVSDMQLFIHKLADLVGRNTDSHTLPGCSVCNALPVTASGDLHILGCGLRQVIRAIVRKKCFSQANAVFLAELGLNL